MSSSIELVELEELEKLNVIKDEIVNKSDDYCRKKTDLIEFHLGQDLGGSMRAHLTNLNNFVKNNKAQFIQNELKRINEIIKEIEKQDPIDPIDPINPIDPIEPIEPVK